MVGGHSFWLSDKENWRQKLYKHVIVTVHEIGRVIFLDCNSSDFISWFLIEFVSFRNSYQINSPVENETNLSMRVANILIIQVSIKDFWKSNLRISSQIYVLGTAHEENRGRCKRRGRLTQWYGYNRILSQSYSLQV